MNLANFTLTKATSKKGAELIEKAAAGNYTSAIIQFAEMKMDAFDFETALQLFKKASRAGDVDAMEKAVDLCVGTDDRATLNEIAKIIQSYYNDIYTTKNFLGRMMCFGSSKPYEYLNEYARAIERRRIFNRIQEMLNA